MYHEDLKNLLLDAGERFALRNSIEHKTDSRICFATNGEECYNKIVNLRWRKLEWSVFALCLTGVTYMIEIPQYIAFLRIVEWTLTGAFICYLYVPTGKLRMTHQMMTRWAPVRSSLKHLLLEYHLNSEVLGHLIFCHEQFPDAVPNVFDELVTQLAKKIVCKLVSIKSATGLSIHEKQDSDKFDLDLVADAFGIEIPWDKLLDAEIAENGRSV